MVSGVTFNVIILDQDRNVASPNLLHQPFFKEADANAWQFVSVIFHNAPTIQQETLKAHMIFYCFYGKQSFIINVS